ncbi:hypothetical protein [Dactylosporangium sp. NPDC000521]|uniref:hypothetical protein n=1 Tax=Dactylosporangium sp. NPDC000521 TaxID=3363975 RepID=UPI0036C098A8
MTAAGFVAVLDYHEYDGGFVLATTGDDETVREHWTVVQERVIGMGLVEVLPPQVEDTAGTPLWSLAHVKYQRKNYWCFIEQGRGGHFGAGGCRFHLASINRHPADVWTEVVGPAHLDAAEAWNPEATVQILAGIAGHEEYLRLPGSPAQNAHLIGRLLAVVPRKVAVDWVWSTCLFAPRRPFVAGPPPRGWQPDPAGDDAVWAAAVPAPRQAPALGDTAWRALRLLAAAVDAGEVPAGVADAVRASTAELLPDFLADRRLAAALPAGVAVPGPVAPAGDGPRLEERETELLGGHRTAPAPVGAGAGAVPVVARPRPVESGRAPLTWVTWRDSGDGFNLVEESVPRMYRQATEFLREEVEVPEGYAQTLSHPLWSLRRVRLDGNLEQWCFIEVGRGIRAVGPGEDRNAQFGQAGGCRFGFADIRRHPFDVWRAGAEQAWSRPAETEAVAGGAAELAEVLAKIAKEQRQILLPGSPSANAVLIDQALAVLPSRVAEQWTWSTCLFRAGDRFVAGPVPPKLRVPKFARVEAKVARVPVGARADDVRAGLDEMQLAAFDVLAVAAENAAGAPEVPAPAAVRTVLSATRASKLMDFLNELVANVPGLRPIRVEDVPALLRGTGVRALVRDNAGLVRQWAGTWPDQALDYLLRWGFSPDAAPEVVAGLIEAQRARPARNVLGVPTAAMPKPEGSARLCAILRDHGPAVGVWVALIEALTRPGAVLHDQTSLATAEPWLRKLGLKPADAMHLFPDAVAGALGQFPVSKQALAALRRLVAPVDVLRRVIHEEYVGRRAGRAAAGKLSGPHAAVLLRAAYALDMDLEQFHTFVRQLLRRIGKEPERRRWLVEVVMGDQEQMPVEEPGPGFVRAVLVTGGRLLSDAAKGQPIADDQLYALSQAHSIDERIGKTDRPLFCAAPPVRGRASVVGGWVRHPVRGAAAVRQRFNAVPPGDQNAAPAVAAPAVDGEAAGTVYERRRRSTLRGWGWAAVTFGAVMCVMALWYAIEHDALGSSAEPGQAVPSARPSAVIASTTDSTTGSPPPAATTEPLPSATQPSATQPEPSNSVEVQVPWQNRAQNEDVVAAVRAELDQLGDRQIVRVTVHGVAQKDSVAENVASEVSRALRKEVVRLNSVPIRTGPRIPGTGEVRVVIYYA